VFPNERIVCIVVTHDRPECLEVALSKVLSQTRPPDCVIVVDNGNKPRTAEVVAKFPEVRHVASRRNLGGAGGFALALMLGMVEGADWIWTMDDDGFPATPTCLASLREAAEEHHATVVGPMIMDDRDHTKLAFPFRIGARYRFSVAEVEDIRVLPNIAYLFNGILFHASVFERVGLPDIRLFFRGDELDLLARMRIGGETIVTTTSARFCHPASTAEIHPFMSGLAHAVVPETPIKQFYLFRNRGYIFPRRRMLGYFVGDFLRYGWFFLIHRKGDFQGFSRWAQATLAGASGRLRPYVPHSERRAVIATNIPIESSGMRPYAASADSPETQIRAQAGRSQPDSETAELPLP
jgi:rhamnopyranosyl-N-acetylglucosaminyl-diphospho-decaprenol beta-1,3/1,4-galactofuranosyltransferase